MIIAYTQDGALALVNHLADSGMSIEALADIVVPEGLQHYIIDPAALPEDSTYSAAWALDLSSGYPTIVVDEAKKATIDRQIALRALEEWFQAQIAAGFTTADGWVMGMEQSDVTLLTGNYVLAKESAALGGPIPPVVDKDGLPHPFDDITDLTMLMLAYGQHRAEISAEYATRRAELVGG